MHWRLNYKDVFPEQGIFFQELKNICCEMIISHLIIY